MKVIRQALSKELTDFVYLYFFESKYISPFADEWGRWDDTQVPDTYFHYSDLVMETLLQKMKPLMEKETQTSLIETYSCARIYKKGDELKKHTDRPSCEISCTLNLGGEMWPIFLDGEEILLNPGDMLIYKGHETEHWREPFTGNNCAQVFLHYNEKNGKFNDTNKYDGRPFLGLPQWFKEDK